MLFWLVTAIVFSCCLFLDLYTFIFVFGNCKSVLSRVEIRSLHWPLKNIEFVWLEKPFGCFCSLFWTVIHLHCDVLSDQFAAFSWIITKGIALYCTKSILLSAVIINSSGPVPLVFIEAHTITLLSYVSHMLQYVSNDELFFPFHHTFSHFTR